MAGIADGRAPLTTGFELDATEGVEAARFCGSWLDVGEVALSLGMDRDGGAGAG